jgi:inorganic pyrophosphatase
MFPTLEETKRSIDEALHYATICAAFKVKITDPEIKTIEELNNELETKSQTLFLSLKNLREKYNEWLNFHTSIESGGASGNLSAQQSENQVKAHLNLENARTDFLVELRSNA